MSVAFEHIRGISREPVILGAQLQVARHRGRLPDGGRQPRTGTGTPHSASPTSWTGKRGPNGPGTSSRTSRKGGNRHRGKNDTANPDSGRQGTGRGGLPQKAASAARRDARRGEPRGRTKEPEESATQGRAAGAKRRGGRAAEPTPDPGRASPARHGGGGRHTPRQRPAAREDCPRRRGGRGQDAGNPGFSDD